MPNLFISREIADDSPILAFAQANGYTVFASSLIEFLPVQFGRVPPTDWVFFYSKRAVTFFFRQLQQRGTPLSREVSIAVLGDGTAKALKEFGRSPDFSGNGKPEWVAEAFLGVAAGQRVLFPRARQSRQSVQQHLRDKLSVYDLVVYDNQIKADITVPDCDILLLTSPINVKAWQQNHAFRPEEQTIVAIGKTTGEALSKLGVTPRIAPEPSEEGLLSGLTSENN